MTGDASFMIHKEMPDIQWNTVASYLPKPAKTGRPGCNDRNTINGILFVLTTGCRWQACQTERFKIHCISEILRTATKRMNQLKFFCRQIRPCMYADLIGSDGIFFHIHQLLAKRGGYDAAYIGDLQMSRNQMLHSLQEKFQIRCAREVQNMYGKAGFAVEKFPCMAQVRVEKNCGKV